ERARRILELPDQAEAARRARGQLKMVAVPLDLPWSPEAALEARWINVYADDGGPELALVVEDRTAEDRSAEMRHPLARAAAMLRKAARSLHGGGIGAEVEKTAEETERAAGIAGDALALEPAPLEELLKSALEDIRAQVTSSGIEVEMELADPSVRVVEANGR